MLDSPSERDLSARRYFWVYHTNKAPGFTSAQKYAILWLDSFGEIMLSRIPISNASFDCGGPRDIP